jgi:MFS family permease
MNRARRIANQLRIVKSEIRNPQSAIATAGYLLLEVLLALAILTIIVALVFRIIQTTVRVTTDVQYLQAEQEHADGLYELLRKHFDSMPQTAEFQTRHIQNALELVFLEAPFHFSWTSSGPQFGSTVIAARRQADGLYTLAVVQEPEDASVSYAVSGDPANARWIPIVDRLRECEPATMDQWGWRVPFWIGCLIIPLLYLLRRSLAETDEFLARKQHPSIPQILRTLADNWAVVLTGLMIVTMTTVSFYLITAYTPTFGQEVLHLSPLESLAVTLCVGISNFIWLPVMGSVSDRIGRRPVLITFTVAALLTSYPIMFWLVVQPSFLRLLLVELWLSFIYASYNGGMVVMLTEIMPVEVRTSGLFACLQSSYRLVRR